MKIGNSIVVVFYILPDFHGVIFVTVKSSIHKFYLCSVVIKEKLQLFFDYIYIPEANSFIYGWKTITAWKRATSTCFIIDYFIFKILHVLVHKRNLRQIHGACVWNFNNFVALTINQPFYIFVRQLVIVVIQKFLKRLLPFLTHNVIYCRIFHKHISWIVRNLRSAHYYNGFGSYHFQVINNFLGKCNVPYITGKAHHICLLRIYVRQYFLRILVYCVFFYFNLVLV